MWLTKRRRSHLHPHGCSPRSHFDGRSEVMSRGCILQPRNTGTLSPCSHTNLQVPSWELTYPPFKKALLSRCCSFSRLVRYVGCLEGTCNSSACCMNKTHIPFVTKGLPHCSHGCFLHPKSFRHPHDWLQTSSILMCLYTVYPRLDCIPGPRPKCMRQSHERFFSAGTLQSVFTTNVCIGALLLPMVANDSWLFVN